MTRDQIGQLADKAIREATRENWNNEWLEIFTHYIQVYEREQCARIAESYEPQCDSCPRGVAKAIRGRS